MTKLYLGLLVISILLISALYYNFSADKGLIPLPEGGGPDSSSTTGEEPYDSPTSGTGTPAPKPAAPPSAKPSAASGRVLFAVTDAAAPLSGIKSIFLTVDKLSVHSKTGGWINVPVGSKTYDLLQLRRDGAVQLLADANLAVDTSYTNSRVYDEIRLNISKVSVLLNTGETKEAKLPSGDLRIIGGYTAKKGAISTVIFDFVADQSLHTAVDGRYIFAPVLKFQSWTDNIVSFEPNQRIKIAVGTSKVEVAVGINENGEVKYNFALNPNIQIEILQSGTWKIFNPGESDVGLKIKAEKAIEIAKNNGAISSVTSIRLLSENSKTYWLISGLRGGAATMVKIESETGVIVGG